MAMYSGRRVVLSTCTAILVMPLNIGTFSVSWKVPVPRPFWGPEPPRMSKGKQLSYATWAPVTPLVTPGPAANTATPTWFLTYP